MELSRPNIFFSKKSFFYIRKIELFRKWNFAASYFYYISGENFPSSQNKKKPTLKKFLIFQEMELSSSKTKKALIFQEGTRKALKSKFSYIAFHIFCLLRENFSNISAKEKSFLYFPF